MKGAGPWLGAAGAAAAAILVWHVGAAAVLDAAVAVGASGLVLLLAIRAAPLAACATAWWTVAPRTGTGVGAFLWFRWLRDAASEVLSLVPAAGEVAALRAMALAGVPWSAALAGLVVDLTVEMAAQIAFALIGAALFALVLGETDIALWTLGGTLALAALAAGFVAAQKGGLGGLPQAVIARLVPADLAAASLRLGHEVRDIYRRRRRVLAAFLIHLSGWLMAGVETWIALWLLEAPLGLAAAIAIESTVFALRSAAFFVPAGLGVQEGAYALAGAVLGLTPETALALALVKRARELLLSAPALLLWQVSELREVRRASRTPSA